MPAPVPRSMLDAIGQTPLVEACRSIERLGLQGRVLVKLEYCGPGGSKKDRVALAMIEEARASGSLRPGQTVVELTSGNMGTGLAIVCRAFGHPFVAVMSRGNSPERAAMMRAFGAEVVLVDQAPGSPPGQVSGKDLELVARMADRLIVERGAYSPRQFENPASVWAHERTTGPELWSQSNGEVRVFLDCPGTGGSLTGIGRALKRACPEIRVYAVEPARAAVLAGKTTTAANHRIQGAGYGRSGKALPLFDPALVDGYIQVEDEDVITSARILAAEDGIFGGFSTGAHFAAARQLLEGPERGQVIGFLACDSGMKYLSTDLYA